MEWESILIMQIPVVFAAWYLCAGLMRDFSWPLVAVGSCFAIAAIGLLVKLFLFSLGSGFAGLGISAVVAFLCFLLADSVKDEKADGWTD